MYSFLTDNHKDNKKCLTGHPDKSLKRGPSRELKLSKLQWVTFTENYLYFYVLICFEMDRKWKLYI